MGKFLHFKSWTLFLTILSVAGSFTSCNSDIPERMESRSASTYDFPRVLTTSQVVSIHTDIHADLLGQAVDSIKTVHGLHPITDQLILSVATSVIDHRKITFTQTEQYVFNQQWRQHPLNTDSIDSIASLAQLPNNMVERLENALASSDYNLLDKVIATILTSQEYGELDSEWQHDIEIDLNLLAATRDNVLAQLVMLEDEPISRMSPGDRMVWSGAMSQLSDKQRKKIVKVLVWSITGFLPKKVAEIVGFISIFLDE